MSGWFLAFLIVLVAVTGALGGAATRYERRGPVRHRGPAGALAVISLTLAVTVALVAVGLALLQTDAMAWRLLGLASIGGVFGGLVGARGVDHYLVVHSMGAAARGLRGDARRAGDGVRDSLSRLPWGRIGEAVSGRATVPSRRSDAER